MKETVKRRDFIKSMSLATAACTTGMGSVILSSCYTKTPEIVNKRDAVFGLLTDNKPQDYYPAGFFIHFGKDYNFGDAAINRHLEYFKFIDMDFIKIQYELTFPRLNSIRNPSDWLNMPLYKKDFYEPQLKIVKGLVDEGKSMAPVIITLYSPFMCAGHSITDELLTEHLKEDPEMVKKGLDIITESVMIFVKECVKLGVDGFLTSSQGGEAFRSYDKSVFLDYIKPTDMRVMGEVNSACNCNILHVCDYAGGYDDLSPFLDYPGQIVNLDFKLGEKELRSAELYKMFGGRPIMGGMDKKGIITKGTEQEIQGEVSNVLGEAPPKFILGANCTIGTSNWENIRIAVKAAHNYIA
ncbi:MAG: hypothetical protein KAT31_03000 [Bacteroidales bacterium]|nr:hypothetical protein [Bacteroidales bacterium]